MNGYSCGRSIDLDRLHSACATINSCFPKQKGRTFAFIMTMLGQAWLGGNDNKYLYITTGDELASDVMRQVSHFLKQEGFEFDVNRSHKTIEVVSPTRCTFYFCGSTSKYKIEAISRWKTWDRVFFDLPNYITKQIIKDVPAVRE